jgi:putative hydroxymethylpyrimidine transport system permease protein
MSGGIATNDDIASEMSHEPVTTGSANAAKRGTLRLVFAFVVEWMPSLGLAIALFAAWEAIVRLKDIQRWLLPAPSGIGEELWSSRSTLWSNAVVTGEEVVIGFGIAIVVGIALAVAISYSRLLERAVYPFVIASQTIPIIALAPLLLVWVGPEKTSKIIIVALITFFPIVVNLVDGLRSADRASIDMFRTLGATRWQIFLKLQAPSALPFFFSGLKISAVFAVIGAVIGEWVGGSAGLGWLMQVSRPLFRTELVFASIFVLSAMAILLFLLVVFIERWALRHYPHGEQI